MNQTERNLVALAIDRQNKDERMIVRACRAVDDLFRKGKTDTITIGYDDFKCLVTASRVAGCWTGLKLLPYGVLAGAILGGLLTIIFSRVF